MNATANPLAAARFDLIDAHMTLGMLLAGPEVYQDANPVHMIDGAIRSLEAARATMTQGGH